MHQRCKPNRLAWLTPSVRTCDSAPRRRQVIQRRCSVCSGSGLVQKGRFYRKCPECGGFFPWQGWRRFFTSTAAPGNGGPLRQPRGQTSVLYRRAHESVHHVLHLCEQARPAGRVARRAPN